MHRLLLLHINTDRLEPGTGLLMAVQGRSSERVMFEYYFSTVDR